MRNSMVHFLTSKQQCTPGKRKRVQTRNDLDTHNQHTQCEGYDEDKDYQQPSQKEIKLENIAKIEKPKEIETALVTTIGGHTNTEDPVPVEQDAHLLETKRHANEGGGSQVPFQNKSRKSTAICPNGNVNPHEPLINGIPKSNRTKNSNPSPDTYRGGTIRNPVKTQTKELVNQRETRGTTHTSNKDKITNSRENCLANDQ